MNKRGRMNCISNTSEWRIIFNLYYMFNSKNVEASSKAEGLIMILNKLGQASLSELMDWRVNWVRLASVSTYISEARKLLRKQGKTIKCNVKHKKNQCFSDYQIVSEIN